MVSSNKSLELLEELLNKYDETLFTEGKYKSFQDAMKAIRQAYCKSFDKNRIAMMVIGVLNGEDIKGEESTKKHDLETNKPKCKHIDENGFDTIAYDSSYEMRSSDMHCSICGKEGSREELEKDKL